MHPRILIQHLPPNRTRDAGQGWGSQPRTPRSTPVKQHKCKHTKYHAREDWRQELWQYIMQTLAQYTHEKMGKRRKYARHTLRRTHTRTLRSHAHVDAHATLRPLPYTHARTHIPRVVCRNLQCLPRVMQGISSSSSVGACTVTNTRMWVGVRTGGMCARRTHIRKRVLRTEVRAEPELSLMQSGHIHISHNQAAHSDASMHPAAPGTPGLSRSAHGSASRLTTPVFLPTCTARTSHAARSS
jgi:hypothetical protein